MRSRCLPAVLILMLAASTAAQSVDPDAQAPPSVEALVARGIEHWNNRKMREGLEELRNAVSLRPDWPLARRALAAALLRAGKYEEASGHYTVLLGEDTVAALMSPGPGPDGLTNVAVADDVLGLAVAEQHLGRTRTAERIYRALVDIVGPASDDAARVYYRIGDMFAETDDAWIDGEAERTKALAVLPELDTSRLLPHFPDPREEHALEPYVRPVRLAASVPDTASEYDRLPELVRWVAPPDSIEGGRDLAEGRTAVDILVGADGAPLEVTFPTEVSGADTLEADDRYSLLTAVVKSWLFEPALSEGLPVEALITFGDAGETRGEEPEKKPVGNDEDGSE